MKEKKRSRESAEQNFLSLNWQMKTKTWFVRFFKCSLNFGAHALQSELSKVMISNFVKFKLQSMSLKIKQEFEKKNIIFHQNRAKRLFIMQL